jgi:hypothetical protein
MTLRVSRVHVLVALAAVLAYLFAPAALAALPPLATGATTSLVDLDSAMKIYFNDPIVENVVTDAELLNLFLYDNNVQYEKTTGGRFIETAQYFALPTGVGARARGEYIPVPEGPVIKNSKIYLKKLQGVVEMEGDVMARVRTDIGAYVDWMERALPDLVTRLNDSVDRMLLGYGAGILARVNEAVPDTTVPVDTAFGASLGGTLLSQSWLNFLEGDRIVFSANPTGQPLRNAGANQSAKVTDINSDTGIITIDALPTGVADNDYIFMGDGAGASTQTAAGDDREIMGLLGMVDDGTILATFQNLARGTYRLWKSICIDGSDATLDNNAGFNGVLSEELLTFADDQTMVLGGGKPDLIATSRYGLRSYWKSLKGDRTINDPRSWAGGKGPVSIILGDRTLPIKAVRKMPPQLCFGLQTNTFKRWELDGFQWDDKTGAIWNRVTDGTGRKDAFYAVGNWYMQTGCLAPRKSFRIHNVGVA